MNPKGLSELIALGEGCTTEFKRSSTSGLGREICAFANATGGTILLGVEDNEDLCGVANHNRLKSSQSPVPPTLPLRWKSKVRARYFA
ncbi:MAG: ATP-binding protein [Rhodothermaceae bacterium]|nr:ATP-binding protein [Bacteroidota bacterium]MXZ17105.1 ATP-binding protein [Rhodothermaceae bacterium]MYG69256.1 ATP-binding protein [Rhodothermaceae bacterium]MYJ45212.1 ATP-binding protein [Rhodothermaceae bacterium]